MEAESSQRNTSRQLSTSSVEESVQMIKSEMIPCLQNAMQTLQNIWSEIGLQEDQREERTRSVLFHLRNLLQEMVSEEEEMKATLQANVETCTQELEKLSQELGLPVEKPEKPMSILMLENDLRTKVDNLKLEKHERMKKLKTLRETESKFCNQMCLPAHNLGDVNVPTKEQLKELEANVEYLQKEHGKRLNTFKELKQSIQTLWREIETVPSTSIEKELAKSDAETTFKLSSDNMEHLRGLNTELENQQKRLIAESSELTETIKSLWSKLEVDESDRKVFLAKHVGSKPSVITKLKEEVQRLQALKLQHMQKFIEGLRKELSDLWDKCYFGPAQREEFSPAFDDNFTEELLSLHEHQVEVMKNYYEGNKDIFKLVEKRETLFKTMEEFENRKNDTNRLANRGGALLKEEKMRRGINKELPKIEQKLVTQIKMWEEENERRFLINGCHYMDIINRQWAVYNAQKEQEKLERQKQKQELMEKEMVYGSKPATTPKKKRPIGGGTTPLKTPKRMKMQDYTSTPSRLHLHSSICPSPRSAAGNTNGRPPLATKPNIRKVAKTIKKKVTPSSRRQSARLAVKRKVLANKNGNSSKVLNSTGNTSIQVLNGFSSNSNKNESMVVCTSYNEFANGLAQEENNCRSSMLSRTHSVISFV